MAENMVSDIVKKHRISDQESLKKILKHYLHEIGAMVKDKIQDEVKQATISDNPSLAEKNNLQEELNFERALNQKLNEQLKTISEEFDKFAKEKIPNFELLKQKIVEDTMTKDKMSFVQTLYNLENDKKQKEAKVKSKLGR